MNVFFPESEQLTILFICIMAQTIIQGLQILHFTFVEKSHLLCDVELGKKLKNQGREIYQSLTVTCLMIKFQPPQKYICF